MQNKLQELTDKLYSEGLSKGKQEAQELKEKAEKEAESIIAKANERYKEILDQAKKDTEDFKFKTENEIRIVATQALATVKQSIEKLVVTKAIEEPLKESLNNTEFLADIIKSAIKAFNPDGSNAVGLEVLLPQSKKEELDNFIKSNSIKLFSEGVKFNYDDKIESGFKIGPKDEGYHISFTQEDFQALLSQYLKPATRQFLFLK